MALWCQGHRFRSQGMTLNASYIRLDWSAFHMHKCKCVHVHLHNDVHKLLHFAGKLPSEEPCTTAPVPTMSVTPPHSCPPGQFVCKTKRECVSLSQVCDFTPDCSDSSDEEHCGTHYPSIFFICPPICPFIYRCFLFSQWRSIVILKVMLYVDGI